MLKFWPYSDICQNGEVYLRTFFVWRPKWSERFFGIKTGGIYLHQFLKSDHNNDPHDHAWNYRTFILRGSYWDVSYEYWDKYGLHMNGSQLLKPGMTVKRPWSHTHLVILEDEKKPVWTLMFVGRVQREFNFWTDDGPVLWWKYLGFSAKPE